MAIDDEKIAGEGRDAYYAGKSKRQNPYKGKPAAFIWRGGFDDAKAEAEQEEADTDTGDQFALPRGDES